MSTATSLLPPPATAYAFDRVDALGSTSVSRTITVAPSMCGNNNLLVGRIGDWTWEAVSHACGINAFRATDAAGRPTYLSFYYFDLRAAGSLSLNLPTFGDRLHVVSTCYRSGSESVITLHRLATSADSLRQPVAAEEMAEARRPDSLYALTVNRWIARSGPGNEALCSAAPEHFRTDHLPPVADHLSPRLACDRARRAASFSPPGELLPLLRLQVASRVETAQDLNGVGLLHFSSFFAIANKAVCVGWTELGRTAEAYLARRLLAQRMLYLGNADAGTDLSVEVTMSAVPGVPAERADIRLLNSASGNLLAVAEMVAEPRS